MKTKKKLLIALLYASLIIFLISIPYGIVMGKSILLGILISFAAISSVILVPLLIAIAISFVFDLDSLNE